MAETSTQAMVCHSMCNRATELRLHPECSEDRHRQEEEQRAEDDLVFVDRVSLHDRPAISVARLIALVGHPDLPE